MLVRVPPVCSSVMAAQAIRAAPAARAWAGVYPHADDAGAVEGGGADLDAASLPGGHGKLGVRYGGHRPAQCLPQRGAQVLASASGDPLPVRRLLRVRRVVVSGGGGRPGVESFGVAGRLGELGSEVEQSFWVHADTPW
ncbi:hypothetical protein [Micromonospora deserti]|uniref:hypothetical protein n=1 Tax=Micromonospora deserti TaxID=2070366 RepID=UPI001315027F|nr:hypothetical protein [Micromonospora deserti]